MLNVRVYFLDLFVIFCTWGQVKGGSLLLIWPKVGLSHGLFFKKKLERIVRDGHWKTKGRNVLKMWRIAVTADRSEWIWVDLHIFTEVSIRQLETSWLFFQFQLLIQKGMNEGWYVSSVGPTLYRNYLERLTFSCSYCFLPFFYMLPRKDADVKI